MSGETRTAVVNVLVREPVEIDEPEWCAGHSSPRAGDRVDISHTGPEHVIAPDGREMFRAFLTQAPFSNIDRAIGLYIEEQDVTGTYTPDEVEQLADALTESAPTSSSGTPSSSTSPRRCRSRPAGACGTATTRRRPPTSR